MKFHFTSSAGGRTRRLTRKVRAFDIEVERAAIDTLFPIAIVSAPRARWRT